MALRSTLPVYMVAMLGTATAGLGLGYGLGQYTVTGMDPFLSMARSSSVYRETTRDNEFASTRFAEASSELGAVFDPAKPAY